MDFDCSNNEISEAEADMAAELFSGGADPETAAFQARMLHQRGWRLVRGVTMLPCEFCGWPDAEAHAPDCAKIPADLKEDENG